MAESRLQRWARKKAEAGKQVEQPAPPAVEPEPVVGVEAGREVIVRCTDRGEEVHVGRVAAQVEVDIGPRAHRTEHRIAPQRGGDVLRFDIAQGKAYGAIGMGTNSRNLANVAKERPHFINALIGASDGKVVPVAGGLLIKTADGQIIGAIGVSGDASDNDEIAGIAGIEAAGLATD